MIFFYLFFFLFEPLIAPPHTLLQLRPSISLKKIETIKNKFSHTPQLLVQPYLLTDPFILLFPP